MKNIKKLKTTNPLRANLKGGDRGVNPEVLNNDLSGSPSSGGSSSGSSSSGSSSSESSWWNVADSLGNTLISVFQGIVSPLLGGSSNSVMVVENKHNTTKFVVYGIIAIVLIVILFKYLKK